MSLDILIRQLQGALGGKRIQVGTATFTFTASVDSAVATITFPEPFDAAPKVFVANRVVVGTRSIVAYVEDPTASQFRAFARSDGAAFTGSSAHAYIAIG